MVFKDFLLSSFGQGADSTSRKLKLHTTKTLGLEIDLEGAAGSNIGVTTRVSSLGPTSGHLANTTHIDKYKD